MGACGGIRLRVMESYFEFKESNCKNCHKCIRHCQVKAIGFSRNQAHIVPDECILCGECFVTCPQNAKEIRDDLPNAKLLLQSGAAVYASVAPSAAAAFPGVSFASIRDSLSRLGFAGAEETAIGATIVKKRYEELIRENKQGVILTTCCHSVNRLVQIHYPAAIPCLAKVASPMLAHGMSIKKAHPGSKVVFIGPCVSKKAEAEEYPGIIDCVLTFEDLSSWLRQQNVEPASEKQVRGETGRARLFPTSGGILDTMDVDKDSDYSLLSIDGIRNCITVLEDVVNGNLDHCFIELSACTGSCVGGPAMVNRKFSPMRGRIAVRKTAGREDFPVEQPDGKTVEKTFPAAAFKKVMVSDSAIRETLEKMGKTLPEHELNCGSCGYETCRDKAYAVLMGKAEINMCMPYLMARAESFSDNIIGNTPNGILVMNRELVIEQINAAACALVNVKDGKEVMGRNVTCILDPAPFTEAITEEHNIYERQLYLEDYEKYISMTVVIENNFGIIIAFMRDITDEYNERKGKDDLSQQAVDITDKVIEKQMRTVQEIASLLGETTAETKVALERLKETLRK